MDLLLAAGADTKAPNPQFRNAVPLHYASKEGNTDAILALLAAGVDANQLEDTHSTALMYAAYNGHTESVNALLKHGVDTQIRDNGGHTALDWAITQGHPDIAAAIEAANGEG